MKILLVTQNFYPEIGSGANRLKNLYMQLRKEHDVTVLTTEPSYPNHRLYEDEKYWNEPSINTSADIQRLKMRMDKQGQSLKMRVLYYVELAYKVWLYVNKHQKDYDVVYVTSPNIFLPWATLFQRKRKGVKKILEVRDLWPDSVKAIEKININMMFPVLKVLEKMIYRLSDKIVINNEEFRKHILSHTDSKEILYLPNSFLLEELKFKDVESDFKVIYTGNIGFAQSYEQLVEIVNTLEREKVTFNIVGYGFNAHKLQHYIEEKDMKYVTFYAERSREECLEMIRDHNVALSLLKENDVFLKVLPGKIIDAIGSGVPVVSNLGGYSKILINGNSVGYSKERSTPKEIFNMVDIIRNDKDLEIRLRTNSRRLARQQFVWEKNIKSLNHFLST